MVIQTLALKDCSSLRVDEREALRYLGVKEADESVLSLLKSCEKELVELSEPRAVYALVDIANDGENVDFGFMQVKSKSLAKNLQNCSSAYVFAATLGIGVDRLINKYLHVSPLKTSVIGAISSSLIESVCDFVNAELIKEKCSVPRFSAGYGDFSLEHQRDILKALDADKKIGISLTESLMMIPVKSVTAVIGIKDLGD